MTISDLRDRRDFAEAVADRVWRAYYEGLGWSSAEQTEDGTFILTRDIDD